MKQTKKLVKDYVGAGVTLGVGSAVLGGMGQGAIATKIVTPASNMMGVGITASMGMNVMDIVNKGSKKLSKKSKYGGF